MRKFRRDERGLSAIEAAILLPIFILIVMAIIEFGIYFVKYQIASRAVSTIADTIQKNPAAATYALATQEGLSFLDLKNLPNYICAQSYVDNGTATTGLCTTGWVTSPPAGVTAGTPYYVAIRAYAPHISITPFTALSKSVPPPIDAKTVVMVNPNATSGIPAGAVMAFDLDSCPSGWSEMPSLTGRTIVGTGTYSNSDPNEKIGTTTYSRGNIGGLAYYVMSIGQMPKHNHPIRYGSVLDDGDSDYAANGYRTSAVEFDWINSGAGPLGGYFGANGDTKGPFANTKYAGGNAPTDNRQPYYALKYCRKN